MECNKQEPEPCTVPEMPGLTDEESDSPHWHVPHQVRARRELPGLERDQEQSEDRPPVPSLARVSRTKKQTLKRSSGQAGHALPPRPAVGKRPVAYRSSPPSQITYRPRLGRDQEQSEDRPPVPHLARVSRREKQTLKRSTGQAGHALPPRPAEGEGPVACRSGSPSQITYRPRLVRDEEQSEDRPPVPLLARVSRTEKQRLKQSPGQGGHALPPRPADGKRPVACRSRPPSQITYREPRYLLVLSGGCCRRS